MKVYTFSLRNRFAATLAFLALVGLGAAVLFVGATVLAGLAVTGAVVGAGMSIINRLRGRNALPRDRMHTFGGTLDPAMQVFPVSPKRELPPGE